MLDDPMLLALPEHHPLANHTTLTPADLADQEWIGVQPHAAVGRVAPDQLRPLVETFRKVLTEPRPRLMIVPTLCVGMPQGTLRVPVLERDAERPGLHSFAARGNDRTSSFICSLGFGALLERSQNPARSPHEPQRPAPRRYEPAGDFRNPDVRKEPDTGRREAVSRPACRQCLVGQVARPVRRPAAGA
ncbi:hypothetical protein PFAS1_00395 [Pseudomonas frederiksbergensis]|nr:hypothetical protein PFAS1_00395 [Pseudomonas frederiksbergensis]